MAIIPFLVLLLFIFHPKITRGSELSYTNKKLTKTSDKQTYIVHVKQPEAALFTRTEDLKRWHSSFLTSTIESTDGKERMIYSYKNALSGFAARLTEQEVETMRSTDGFVSATPERILKKLTTHTPNFMGLHQETGVWKKSNFGKGVIIGVLDGGVLPTHLSFSDEGMPTPPSKWKGRCEFNASACNNKIIGARSFNVDDGNATSGRVVESPIDNDGHGTHTASTAAGVFVKNADAFGNARGTAVGMAPSAHLAIYKVCFGEDCPESSILAALDAAIEDGIDVLSLSIGDVASPFFKNNIAIGAFAAIQKGIFVSCSAGNSGPFRTTLSNEAPWILTVGASTIDRSIVATAKLGNAEEFEGESLFQPGFPSTLRPLVYSGSNGKQESVFCAEGSLKGIDVKDKIVLCERGGGVARIAKGEEVKNAGGAAMILMNDEPNAFSISADAHVLPATHVSFDAGSKIKAYINSTSTPTATVLFKGTVIGNSKAPVVASFSSRGPSFASPGILKPDIIGPGVSILAAWPFPVDNTTKSDFSFNFESGTSMSCPHLSGIAALLKSSHPYWSPAAIKSAIMTSADILNLEGKPILDETLHAANVFATGAGHVNPTKADNPGLIYDIQPDDYIPYLCGLGYKDEQVGILAHKPVNCSEIASIPEGQLNYPSFSVVMGPSQIYTRTVTNVGKEYSSYEVNVVAPEGVEVSVTPKKLYFSKMNQKATYTAKFSRSVSEYKPRQIAQGYITWVSEEYSVRSPIAIQFM